MSPKLNNPFTRAKMTRLRRSAIAAMLAMTPGPSFPDAIAAITVGVVGSPLTSNPLTRDIGPMEFAPGRDELRYELAAKFDEYGFPVAPPKSRVEPAVSFDITRDDGNITCHNPKRGTTAVFRVETVTRGPLAGKRIVSVLDGYHFVGFGFVDDFGVRVWSKKTGGATPSVFDRYAGFLMDLTGAVGRGVVVEFSRD